MMMLMLAIGAWAATVTLSNANIVAAGDGVGGYQSWTLTDGSNNVWNAYAIKNKHSNATSAYHFLQIKKYASEVAYYIQVPELGAKITSIEMTVSSSNKPMDGGGNTATLFFSDSNTTSAEDTGVASAIGDGSVTIDCSSLDLTHGFITASGAVRIWDVTVTIDDGTEPPVTVATPVITGETPFDENTEVTITCATEGASIYYTLDGADPTSASTPYAGAFELTETTTVKAIAYDATGAASSVATKEFVKEEPVVLTNVATVAEFNALPDNTVFTFTGSLVATGQTGKYLYAEDSDGILIYGNIGQTYSDLAVIPGGWTGKKTTYAGAPEAADPAGFAAATDHADLAPEEMTPAQVTVDNAFRYAVIRGATIDNGNLVVGNESVALYNSRFNVDVPTDGGVYDVIGITGFFNNPQFMPLEFVPQAVDVATPVIEGETPFTESTQVTITCDTEGASIYYTIDGTVPTNESTAYTASFELTESATVKAIAYDATGAASAVASKEFVKEEPAPTCATVTEILALENNTVFTFTGTMTAVAQATSANGNSKYLYAQDADGVGMLFFNAPVDYNKGDVIPAGWEAKRTNYKGAPELTTFSNMTAATETAELTAAEMTPAQVTVEPYNLFHYAVIKGASLGENGTIVAGEESVASYCDRFGVYFPEDYEGKTFDVYGIPSWYNNAQFMPLEIVEVVEPVEPEIEQLYVVGTFNGWSQVDGMIELTENENNEFEGTVELEANAEFKLIAPAEEEGEWIWFGGQDNNGVGYYEINASQLNTEIALVDGANFKVVEGGSYDITVKGITLAPEEKGVQEPLVMVVTKTPTAIEAINMENVKAVRYYNVAGVESATPFQGVNIVVREMTDGTKNVTKMIK